MTAFSFYLPWMVYWRLCGDRMSMGMKLVCLFWAVAGIAVAIAGCYTSIQQMGDMSGGLFKFQDSHCAENSFYIGIYSGGDTVNTNGAGAHSLDQGNNSFYKNYYLPACHGTGGEYQLCSTFRTNSSTWNLWYSCLNSLDCS